MKEPMLVLSNYTKPFEVHMNASKFTIGGVSMQEGHLIAFKRKRAK